MRMTNKQKITLALYYYFYWNLLIKRPPIFRFDEGCAKEFPRNLQQHKLGGRHLSSSIPHDNDQISRPIRQKEHFRGRRALYPPWTEHMALHAQTRLRIHLRNIYITGNVFTYSTVLFKCYHVSASFLNYSKIIKKKIAIQIIKVNVQCDYIFQVFQVTFDILVFFP